MRTSRTNVRLVGGIDRRSIIASEEASLKLSDPVVTFQEGEGGLTCRALLKRALANLPSSSEPNFAVFPRSVLTRASGADILSRKKPNGSTNSNPCSASRSI